MYSDHLKANSIQHLIYDHLPIYWERMLIPQTLREDAICTNTERMQLTQTLRVNNTFTNTDRACYLNKYRQVRDDTTCTNTEGACYFTLMRMYATYNVLRMYAICTITERVCYLHMYWESFVVIPHWPRLFSVSHDVFNLPIPEWYHIDHVCFQCPMMYTTSLYQGDTTFTTFVFSAPWCIQPPYTRVIPHSPRLFSVPHDVFQSPVCAWSLLNNIL